MSEELRPPCPYCGKDNTTLQTTVSVRHRLCKSCGARGPIFYKEEKADYPSWNTRPIEDALRKELERSSIVAAARLEIIDQLKDTIQNERQRMDVIQQAIQRAVIQAVTRTEDIPGNLEEERDALRAELAGKDEEIKALEELVDCLEESADGYLCFQSDKLWDSRIRLAEIRKEK